MERGIEILKNEACHEDYKEYLKECLDYANEVIAEENKLLIEIASCIIIDMFVESEEYFKNCYDAEKIYSNILMHFNLGDRIVTIKEIKKALEYLKLYKIVRKKRQDNKVGYILNVEFFEDSGIDMSFDWGSPLDIEFSTDGVRW